MVNIEINLAVSGVTTIPIANTETEVILHVWYDGNDTFYHNIHRVFLENENDILTCQVWFQQIGQVETEAELLLQDAIRVINIAPNSKKTLIIVAVDKTKIGGERFFADTVSGNSEIDTSSFVTQDSLNQTVSQIYDDLSLTAERIVQNATNPDTSTSAIELTNDRASFFVQTNTVDFIVNEIYTDWDLALQPLALIDVGTLTASQIASLFADYPRPTYDLKPFHDVQLKDLQFFVMRNMECAVRVLTGGTYFWDLLINYQFRFGCILNTSLLTNEFIKITIQNLQVISGKMEVTAVNFPNAGITLPALPSSSVKSKTCAFRIWKDVNATNGANLILSLPLTDTNVVSQKTFNQIDNISFWINNEGWYFGNKEDGKKLYQPLTETKPLAVALPVSSPPLINNIPLQDNIDNTIYQYALGNVQTTILPNPVNQLFPDTITPLPPTTGLNTFSNANQIVFNISSLTQEINFIFRLIIIGSQETVRIQLKNGATVLTSYATTNTNSGEIEFVDFNIQADSTSLSIIPTIKIENQNYYDWAFDSNNYELSVFRMMKEPSTALSTVQYNSLEPDQNLRLFIDLNNQQKYIFLKNLAFFAVRNIYDVFDSNDTFVYRTDQYQDRMLIGLENIPNTIWNFFSMENIFYKQNIPVANNQMFPLSTSLTTNYKNLKPVIQNSTAFGIGRFSIFTFLNQSSERYFTFPIAQNLITEIITGNVNISGKFWFGFFAQPNQPLNIYQCLESERESIARISSSTITTLTIPLDSSFVNTIFYPVIDLPNSLTYNWVYPNKSFNIIRQFLALPVAVPKIYKFYIRLYCVYGSDANATGTNGMIYNYENQFFQGEPRLITAHGVQVQYTFKLKLEYFIDALNTQSVTTEYDIPYPKFFMNDLRVVDLEFEVNENFFHINNTIDAKKRITYLGQRIIKL